MELELFVTIDGAGKQISAVRLSVTERSLKAKAMNNCGERENFGRDPTDAE